MNLAVYVGEHQVATLESSSDFESVLTYHPSAAITDLVSLTMPVRTASYVWDDQLHPFFQMNLPEGYLLRILEEQFGRVFSASPLALLAVVGRNMIGRVRITSEGSPIDEAPRPVDVKDILIGDNSEAAFADLVRQHAASGVSGVVPKFLDTDFGKATLVSHKHIIKGSSARLPHVALNEHLCMLVASKVLPTAKTSISDDRHALIVDRFDVDGDGRMHWGMEDFCALLGLRPRSKYETTWERIARAVRDHVPGERLVATFRHLTGTLLLTYVLRNADCHSKNIALRYTSPADVEICPVYDMLTTGAYTDHANDAPGIAFEGRKTWLPGKSLEKFVARVFGIPVREQKIMVEQISDAIADVAPRVRDEMREHPAFTDIGKRMLLAWREGVDALRSERMYALAPYAHRDAMTGFSEPTAKPQHSRRVDRSDLAAARAPKTKRKTPKAGA